MENSSSMVETCMVCTRNKCHSHWAKATANEPLRANPKALARIFEAVWMYVCGATRFGPSASFPLMYWKRRRWATAIKTAVELSFDFGLHLGACHTENIES